MFDYCVRQRDTGFRGCLCSRLDGKGVKCRRRLGCGGAAQKIHPEPFPTGASRFRSWRVKIAAGMRDRGSHRFNSRMIRVGAGSFSMTGCIGRPIRVRSRLSSPWGVRRLNCPLVDIRAWPRSWNPGINRFCN